MNLAVVDTDVISYMLKSDTRGEPHRALIRGRQLVASFMTIAELEQWGLQAGWSEERIAATREYLGKFTVVHSSTGLVTLWARVMVTARRAGRPMGVADAWIAATALLYDADLITNNRSDFLGVPEVRVVSASGV